MSVSSPGELLTTLARGDYDAIPGTPEAANLDFKEQPSRLDESPSKWELCKDVAALSNTDGGCLVIGYSVRRGPTDVAEVADELRPVPVDLINPDQYKKVLSSGVYPPPSVALHAFTEGLPEGARYSCWRSALHRLGINRSWGRPDPVMQAMEWLETAIRAMRDGDELAKEVRSLLHQRDDVRRRLPRKRFVIGSVSITMVVAVCGVILPMLWSAVPWWVYSAVPATVYALLAVIGLLFVA